MIKQFLNSTQTLKKRVINQRPLHDSVELGLIVIGCQKGGTTALYHYLGHHPNIFPPQQKEINHFNSLERKKLFTKHYSRNFPPKPINISNALSIDVSPAYMLGGEAVASLIKKSLPNIKIAALLRDPVTRAVSSWFMYKKYHLENPDWFINQRWVHKSNIVRRSTRFGESIVDDIHEELDVLNTGKRIEYPIVEYGFYKAQLAPYLNMFGSSNILVIDSEQLAHQTQQCLDNITDHMSLSRFSWPSETLKKHFVGDNKEPINLAKLSFLKDLYRSKNEGLNELLNTDFTWA